LNKDWFEICSYITQKGYAWGMTSNGTLIDEACVQRLAQAGMKTVSISLDGLKESHEQLRGVPGCFDQAVNAIRLLKNSGLFRAVQVVTVVNRLNYAELPRLYELVKSLNVDSWKLTPIEPMGKAKEVQGFFLSPGEHYQLLGFIKSKRQTAPFEVTYGCSHLLPEEYDSTVRKQPFLCGAGTMIASIDSNGDILPCLDIDCRERVKQGNILQDDFVDVWENKFELFRRNKANTSPTCRDCKLKQVCQGDSWHSWDFETNKPHICFEKRIVY
jgi:radical SAM protein with 4Fe4S-binding SPASM domain